ncbi:hypothetical protein [Marinobacter alkaliphilus]|uniref:Uncharacterized protein n=1 Tax=Marinobacter alkaliphilus TaxID=254719 RepID=A0ABZ3E8W3_9GAMM
MHDDKKVAIIMWLIGFSALLPAAFIKMPIFFAFLGMGCILTGSWKFGKRTLIEHRESKNAEMG